MSTETPDGKCCGIFHGDWWLLPLCRKVLADWLISQPAQWTAGIEVAAFGPLSAATASPCRPACPAVRALDAFHVVRLGFAAVDDVRRRVQHHTYGHRGRRDDPLHGIRRVLRSSWSVTE